MDEKGAVLTELAILIDSGSDDPSIPASERVAYYCTEFADELPAWFTDDDKAYLIRILDEL